MQTRLKSTTSICETARQDRTVTRHLLFALVLALACIVMLATPPRVSAQTDIERASEAFQAALDAETALNNSPQPERTRADHLRVIRRYERVYLITPHTGYADDALRSIATLYEEIDDVPDAVTTLRFLIREYPGSRFIAEAREDIARLREPSTPELERIADLGPTEVRRDAPADGPATVENVRYWESQKSVRVVVDLLGDATFTTGEVQNPPRYFVDIHGSRLGTSLERRELPVESMMLESIRVGQNDADTVRVVLDLVQFHNASIFTLRDPNRLVIDVLGDAPQSSVPQTIAALEAEPARVDGIAVESAAPPSPLAPAPAEVVENTPEVTNPTAIEEVEPVIVSIPASPGANGEYSTIRSLGLKVGRVVIDPGHGGHDTGTIGSGGLTEKELVLDMALQLKERIESEIGAEVVLTRGDDTFVPLETRTAMANQAEADLFISIHANSSQTSSIRGFETYFLNLATSSEDREIAARENAASQASISELQDLVQQIMLQDKVEESRELASHIQQAMADRKDFGRDRGVKQAPFVVLIGANMPSILAEVSFISNPDDERLLQGQERRRAIVEALFDGVRSYSDTLSGFRTALAQE